MANHTTKGYHVSLSELETKVASDTAIWRQAEWGDMRVLDTKRICPISMTRIYSDHEEVINAGEVYSMAPGQTMATDAGTVLVEFSPKDEFRKLTEIAEKNFARVTK